MTESFSRRTALVFAGGMAAAAFAPPAKAMTIDDLIRRNTHARGGVAALDRVRVVSIDVQIDEDGQKLNGHYAATRDGLARIDVYADGKSVFSEGLDDQGGWYWNGKEIKASNAGGVAALRDGADNNVLGWHRFEARGHKLALVPEEKIDGVSYPIVEILYSTANVATFMSTPGHGLPFDGATSAPIIRMLIQRSSAWKLTSLTSSELEV